MKKKSLIFIIGGSIFAILVIISAIILILNNGSKPSKTMVTVTFDVDGGLKIDPMKIEKDVKVSLPTTTKSGYNFAGWYYNDKKLDSKVAFASDTTIKAKWEESSKEVKEIKISFDTSEGNKIDPITVECGKAIPELPIPTYKGFDFISWTDNYGKVISKGAILTCDSEELTLHANWEAKEEKFVIVFDSNGGSKVNDLEVKCDTELTLPKNPTKDGYTFVRWEDKNSTPVYDKAKLSCEDITLKAVWEKNKEYKCPSDEYKLTTDSNGKKVCTMTGTVKSESCPEGTKVDGNLCINLNDRGTTHTSGSTVSCDNSYQYISSTDLSVKFGVSSEGGCFKTTSKVKTCYDGYNLVNGICTKTVDAIEK